MSVKIRLRRTGANNDVSYRVVATDSRSPRDGRFIEVLGWYDPKKKGVNYLLKLDRIQHWTSRGAVVSDTVASLIKKAPAAVEAPVAAPAEK
jgi:small subunit ribosomal protein S16